MTKFEALKKITHIAEIYFNNAGHESNIFSKNVIVDEAIALIERIVKEFAPKRTPLDLPLGVKLTHYSSPKEVVFIGTRTVKCGWEGETIQKVCRVIVDVENNVAHAY